MEKSTTELLDETIVISPGQFSAPEAEQKDKEEILKYVSAFLTLPERARTENDNIELPKALGEFLVEQEYNKNIAMHYESWVFGYNSENKTIYISKEEMPQTTWRDFTFRKQTTLESRDGEEPRNEPLGPVHPIYNSNGGENELKVYRFLHETIYAYQEYLKDSESAKRKLDPKYYYENAVNQIIDTPFAKLFSFCYLKRKNNYERINVIRGLSTWGNIEDYNYEDNEEIPNQNSEHASRALKDANELITMYLWNPKYFETYMNYLSPAPNAGELLYKKGLLKLKKEEACHLGDLVNILVEDMKESIGY